LSVECPDCQGTGWRSVARQELHFNRLTEVTRAVKCQCRRAREVLISIPLEYHHAELTGFPASVEEAARAWLSTGLAQAPGDLIVYGDGGTGKTHLACALTKEALRGGRDVTYRQMNNIYEEVQDATDNQFEERPNAIKPRYKRAPVLVLDEIGAGSNSDFERRTLLEIISDRLVHKRPTVVTTNLSLNQIAAKLDDRLASRLGSYRPIRLEGCDRRLPVAAEVGTAKAVVSING